jgi:hypothetical protein
MAASDSNKNEREYWPPPIWKTVQEEKTEVPEPPVTRHVKLPQKVAVRFLAETSGETLYSVAALMNQLRICISVDRSVDFEDAAKILRRYGIAAEREV